MYLNPHQQELIRQRIVLGRKQKDIAKEQGVSPAAVSQAIRRIRAKARKHFQMCGIDTDCSLLKLVTK
jgi:DNA-directed RNA polymerase specialized sigma24 family protein